MFKKKSKDRLLEYFLATEVSLMIKQKTCGLLLEHRENTEFCIIMLSSVTYYYYYHLIADYVHQDEYCCILMVAVILNHYRCHLIRPNCAFK